MLSSCTLILSERSLLLPIITLQASLCAWRLTSRIQWTQFSNETSEVRSNTIKTPSARFRKVFAIDRNFSCPAVSQI